MNYQSKIISEWKQEVIEIIQCTRYNKNSKTQPDLWQSSKHGFVNKTQAVVIRLYHTFRPSSTTVMSPNLPCNQHNRLSYSQFLAMQQTNVLVRKY